MALVYYWKVQYKDGDSFAQFDKDGVEQLWGKVNLSAVESFSWVPFDEELAMKINGNYAGMAEATDLEGARLVLGPDEQVIAFRRNFITSDGRRWTLYCFGTNLRTVKALNERGELIEEVA